MKHVSDLIKTDDWKNEKHVPVIECDDSVPADEVFEVRVTLGKEVAHPNTTEHHIRWMALCFLPEGSETPIEVARAEFAAHGESADGPNEGPVYTHHSAVAAMKTATAGTLLAISYCNIHGVWQASKEITLA